MKRTTLLLILSCILNSKSLGHLESQVLSELLLNLWSTGWDWFMVGKNTECVEASGKSRELGEVFGSGI